MWQGLFPAAPVTVPARLLSAEWQLAGNFSTFSHPESPESNRPPNITHHLSHTHINTHTWIVPATFLCRFFISLPFSVSFIFWLYNHYICQLLRPIFIYRGVCLTSPLHFLSWNLIIFEILIVSLFLLACNINLQIYFSLSLHFSLCWHCNDWASELLTHVGFMLGDSLNIGLNLLYRNMRMQTLLATQAYVCVLLSFKMCPCNS